MKLQNSGILKFPFTWLDLSPNQILCNIKHRFGEEIYFEGKNDLEKSDRYF